MLPLICGRGSLPHVAQQVKNLPAMQETWVKFLGQEYPLEEGMATHSSILAWRISMDRGTWRTTLHRVTKSWTQVHIYINLKFRGITL